MGLSRSEFPEADMILENLMWQFKYLHHLAVFPESPLTIFDSSILKYNETMQFFLHWLHLKCGRCGHRNAVFPRMPTSFHILLFTSSGRNSFKTLGCDISTLFESLLSPYHIISDFFLQLNLCVCYRENHLRPITDLWRPEEWLSKKHKSSPYKGSDFLFTP